MSKIPEAMSVAILGIAATEIAALATGMSVTCLTFSLGIAVMMGIGAYAAHRQQLNKLE